MTKDCNIYIPYVRLISVPYISSQLILAQLSAKALPKLFQDEIFQAYGKLMCIMLKKILHRIAQTKYK